MLYVLVAPVIAIAAPNAVTDTQATTNAASSTQSNSDSTATATTAAPDAVGAIPAVPTLEQALADADTAVRQAQAQRIRQELDLLGNELEQLNTEYFAENTKLATIQTNLTETRDKLRWFEAELEAQRQVLNERLSNIYKHGDMEPVEAILDNASFSELFTRLSLLMKIGEQDAELLGKLHDQKMKVEETKNSLDQLYNQQKDITVQLESRKKAIEDKMRQETALLASIDAPTKQILAQEEAKRQQEQATVVQKLTQPVNEPTPAPTNTNDPAQPQQTQPAQNQSGRIAVQPGTVAFEAIKYLGIPYVWGGENPDVGLDCSGLVKVVFAKFGIQLYHYTGEQVKVGIAVEYSGLQSGDLVFFGSPIHHVGIYLGEGYYIHAPKRNDVVKISKLADRHDYNCSRRIISILPAPSLP
jgi:cell wall-associated NlpC family hydrolase